MIDCYLCGKKDIDDLGNPLRTDSGMFVCDQCFAEHALIPQSIDQEETDKIFTNEVCSNGRPDPSLIEATIEDAARQISEAFDKEIIEELESRMRCWSNCVIYDPSYISFSFTI